MADARNVTVKIEVKTEELVEACIKALVEDGTLVEVVRCKECKWWRDTDHTCREWGGASPRLANAFCSEGERRDDAEVH